MCTMPSSSHSVDWMQPGQQLYSTAFGHPKRADANSQPRLVDTLHRRCLAAIPRPGLHKMLSKLCRPKTGALTPQTTFGTVARYLPCCGGYTTPRHLDGETILAGPRMDPRITRIPARHHYLNVTVQYRISDVTTAWNKAALLRRNRDRSCQTCARSHLPLVPQPPCLPCSSSALLHPHPPPSLFCAASTTAPRPFVFDGHVSRGMICAPAPRLAGHGHVLRHPPGGRHSDWHWLRHSPTPCPLKTPRVELCGVVQRPTEHQRGDQTPLLTNSTKP